MEENKMYAILVNDQLIAVVVEGAVRAFMGMLVGQLPLTAKVETQERHLFVSNGKLAVELANLPAESVPEEEVPEEVQEELVKAEVK